MLENLKLLKDDMKAKSWIICSFLFDYKEVEYIVLVKRFVKENRINEYALVKLHFMKRNNLNDDLEVEANSFKLIVETRILREYFGINYRENLGDILKQFSERLGKSIPQKFTEGFSLIEKEAMVKSLSKSDSKDPDKIYCRGVTRNYGIRERSPYNSDKTKLLRPSLYEYFREDIKISFCYSKEKKDEKSDAEILENFSKNY